ncbi:NPP1 family protein [Nostoc sp.]|uniref:NPP1 family protein n=1 Tax=Nostoc sp. TaxID=1180 RepID=UPI002FEFF1C2
MRNILFTASPGGAHSVKSQNGRRLGLVLLGVVAACVIGMAGVAYAEPPPALPGAGPEADRKFQPAMDYDKDGCYPTPAIGPDGTINPGRDLGGDVNGGCRDESDLDNSNAYSRSQCSNLTGWCAYMYAFYFEKDQVSNGPVSAGHKNDWEHIVVWVQNDTPMLVAVSQHGDYVSRHRDEIPWDGTHPKVVYHKDGGSTHTFRHAKNDGGDEPPENHKGTWQFPTLVGWDNFPPGLRDKLVSADFGEASLALKDSAFQYNLNKAWKGR